MNQSFYKDILDFEKQKAILEDLSKNPSKKTAPPKQEQKMSKPTVKAPLKNEKRKWYWSECQLELNTSKIIKFIEFSINKIFNSPRRGRSEGSLH